MVNKVVLHIADSLSGGGAESVFRSTLWELRKRQGWNHLIACMNSEIYTDFQIDLIFPPTSFLVYSRKNYALIRKFMSVKKPDVIHIQNFGGLTPSIFRAVYRYKKEEKNKGRKIKVINTSHSFFWNCSHGAAIDYRKGIPCTDCSNDRYRKKIFYRGCSRCGYLHSIGKGLVSLQMDYFLDKKLFDYCLTPSDFCSDLVKKRFPYQKVITVRNPLSESFFDIFNSINPSEKEERIVYFGRLSREKNPALLLEAFSILKQDTKYKGTFLEFIGDGDELSSLQKMVTEKAIPNVIFTESLCHEELKKHLRKAKVSVVPSISYETAGLAIPESISMGIIPIVTNHGGLRENIDLFDWNFSFEFNNANDLSLKIAEALENHSACWSNFEPSLKKIKEIMNGEAYADRLLAIYRDDEY